MPPYGFKPIEACWADTELILDGLRAPPIEATPPPRPDMAAGVEPPIPPIGAGLRPVPLYDMLKEPDVVPLPDMYPDMEPRPGPIPLPAIGEYICRETRDC